MTDRIGAPDKVRIQCLGLDKAEGWGHSPSLAFMCISWGPDQEIDYMRCERQFTLDRDETPIQDHCVSFTDEVRFLV